MEKVKLEVLEDNIRLDLYLSRWFDDISREYLKYLIESGYVKLSDNICLKPSKKVKVGDIIEIEFPPPKALELIPQNIPIDIIYEDEDIAVVIKPFGMVVHPSFGFEDKTLVNALLYHLKSLSSIGGVLRPGIVHRLDKDTYGLMVVAKNDISHRVLSDMFKERKIRKNYKALVSYKLKKTEGSIITYIKRDEERRKTFKVASEGKEAITFYKLERYFEKGDISLVDIDIKTGRTHQIRVHMSYLGNPILGDKAYGYKPSRFPKEINDIISGKNMLASYKLVFSHPIKGNELLFEIDMPKEFNDVIEKLNVL